MPRTRDAKGRYFCKPCAEKFKSKLAAKQTEPDPVMAQLLAGTHALQSCPNCAGGIEPGARICIRCGFNRELGTAMRVQVELARKEREEPSAAARSMMDAINAMADSPLGLLFAAVGAFLGGCAGACLYSWVMVSSGYEVFPIAVAIGFLTGLGAFIPLRGFAGTWHGVIAAAIALTATLGGRYIAIAQFADQVVTQETRRIKVGEPEITAIIGRDVASEWASQGKHYQWPAGSDPVSARAKEDFPIPIWTEATVRYAAMDEATREQKRVQANAELRQAINDAKSEMASAAFTQTLNQSSGSFRRRTGWSGYIKWMLVGVCVAFCVGSGGRNPFQD